MSTPSTTSPSDETVRPEKPDGSRAGEHYRILFQRNPSPMLLWDPVTATVIEMNDAARGLFDPELGDVPTGTELRTLLAPEEQERFERHLRHLESHVHLSGPWRIRTKSGRSAFVETTSSALQLDGRATRLVHLVDVTDRVRAEEHARDADALLGRVVEQLPDAFVMLDDRRRIILANPAALSLAGRTRDQVHGAELWSVLPGAASEDLQQRLVAPDSGNQPGELEFYCDDARKWFEVRTHALAHGFAVFVRDVTARKTRVAALDALTGHLSRNVGPAFHTGLVSCLADVLHADGACVARFADSSMSRARILAASAPEAVIDVRTVDLADTPLAMLATRDVVVAHESIPALARHLGIARARPPQACVAVALCTQEGIRRGFLLACFQRAIVDFGVDVEVCRLFAIAATAEIVRRDSLDRLARSEERFKVLAYAATDAVWDVDLLTGETWHSTPSPSAGGVDSPGARNDIGLELERIHPDDRARVASGLDNAIRGTDTHWQEEYRLRRPDDSYAFVLDRALILRDDSGRAVRIIGGTSDISERIEAATRLREQAELLDRASDAIVVCDLDRRIRYWNHGAQALFGWTSNETLGRDLLELFASSRAELESAMEGALRDEDWSGELVKHDKSRREHIVSSRWTLIRTPAGEPRSLLAIDTDVTERRQLEAQFLRAQRLESIGVLAGGIAHDLNNMLTPITMSVDVLKRIHESADTRSLLDVIESSAQRGADLVRQVLGFARGIEGKRILVNPAFVAGDIAKIARDTFPKDIHVRLHCTRRPWLIVGDPTQLHQVLLNLCVNARDAMTSGGVLQLEVDNVRLEEPLHGVLGSVQVGDYASITVRDSGSGIPDEIRERIFDPFFTTKPPGKGTGLGLSTLLAIVKSHNGVLTMETRLGVGSSFRVLLPAEKRDEARNDTHDVGGLPRGRGELVLVVDDEAHIRTISKQTLEAYGYSVIVAPNGAEALSLFLEHAGKVRAVVTDMMMPTMDGPTFVRALRRIDAAVPVIGASGLNVDTMTDRARDAGATTFIPKPYSAEDLLVCLSELLTRRT
jgi:PAS domain S-box-containing protein